MQADSEMQYAEPFLTEMPLFQHYGSWMPIDSANPAPFMLLQSLLAPGKQAADNRSAHRPYQCCTDSYP